MARDIAAPIAAICAKDRMPERWTGSVPVPTATPETAPPTPVGRGVFRLEREDQLGARAAFVRSHAPRSELVTPHGRDAQDRSPLMRGVL